MNRIMIASRAVACAAACALAACSSQAPSSETSSTTAADAPKQAGAPPAEFANCLACHSVLGDGVGPNLHGVFGRKAGTQADFVGRYSQAMTSSGIVWDETSLDAFLAHPDAKVKGTHMLYPGLPDAARRRDLIRYLKTY
jgi:cytochrome c